MVLGIAGNLLFGETRQVGIVEDRLAADHEQAVVLSRKRRVDSSQIVFNVVHWRNIKMLEASSYPPLKGENCGK